MSIVHIFFITITTLSENSIISYQCSTAGYASKLHLYSLLQLNITGFQFLSDVANSDPESLKHDVGLNEGMHT